MRDHHYTTRKKGRGLSLALTCSLLMHVLIVLFWLLVVPPSTPPSLPEKPVKALALTLNSEAPATEPIPEPATKVTQPEPSPRPKRARRIRAKSPARPVPPELPKSTLKPIDSLVRKKPDTQPPLDPKSLFRADPSKVSEIIPMDPLPSTASNRFPAKPGRRLFAGWRGRSEKVSQSLLGSAVAVRPGNHAVVQPSPGYREYIHRIHHKIHLHWANGFLIELDLRRSASDPLSNSALNTELEFVIDSSDGAVESVNVVRSSGQALFDAEAISVAHRVGPHPSPPPELVSPNGRIYIHWNFWRNQRQCGVFGVSIFRLNADGLSQPG